MTAERTDHEALWRDWHRRFAKVLGDSTRVRDGADSYSVRVDERLLQAVWCDQLFKPGALTTASGKAVEVIEPGRWNTSRGPDFLDARLRIAGEVLEGDVEIHVESADWTRHGHDRDFEYNRVILHVALHAHDDRPYEEKQNGLRLERLLIEHALEPDLETIRTTINLSDYPYGRPNDLGVCHEQFLRLEADELEDFLLTAGRARLEQKIARFAAQRATADFVQAMYQALMTAQGFKGSKTLYFLLSKRTPIRELLDYGRDVPPAQREDLYFSALLHVGQLFPVQTDLLEDHDDETKAFLARLQEVWKPVRPYLADRLIPPTKRWYAGMRPAGFPTRRLAAVAVLMGRLTRKEDNLFRGFLDRLAATDLKVLAPRQRSAFWKELVAGFEVDGDAHYFGTRFTFGGKKQNPTALLGTPAAQSLVFNVFLPLAVLYAREKGDTALEQSAWRAAVQFPALEKNSVVKFMSRRLFGDTGRELSLLKMEVYQQSLLKVFSDCCAQNERTCEDCTFLALAEKLRGVTL